LPFFPLFVVPSFERRLHKANRRENWKWAFALSSGGEESIAQHAAASEKLSYERASSHVDQRELAEGKNRNFLRLIENIFRRSERKERESNKNRIARMWDESNVCNLLPSAGGEQASRRENIKKYLSTLTPSRVLLAAFCLSERFFRV
jgi:hypothetical protein